MIEKKITITRWVLLVLCFGMVAGSIVAHHEMSRFLANGDPTQLTHPALPRRANAIPVKITTPQGTHWKYVNFQGGLSLAEFLNNMGEELFGKAAYAQVAQGSSAAADPAALLAAPHKKPQGRKAGPALRDSLTPRAPNMVHLVARHADGTIFYDKTVHNLRTNAGINWQYNQMAGTTAAVCTYIALSNDAGAPGAADTAVASEITANGLSRAAGAASHASNATSYTLAYTFTATGAQSAQKAGILNNTSGGTLCFENTFSAVSLANNDTLAVTWTVTF